MNLRNHELYMTLADMRQRCNNPKHKVYEGYGGRGIKVCKRWDISDWKSTGFKNFLSDMGERPEGLTLERINNDGNYTPSNCKWASQKEQGRNKRSNVVYEGEFAIDASRRLTGGRGRMLVSERLSRGWTKARAFTEPCGAHNAVRYKGESMQAASLRLGGCKSLVWERIKRGWSLRRAFETSKRTKGNCE